MFAITEIVSATLIFTIFVPPSSGTARLARLRVSGQLDSIEPLHEPDILLLSHDGVRHAEPVGCRRETKTRRERRGRQIGPRDATYAAYRLPVQVERDEREVI